MDPKDIDAGILKLKSSAEYKILWLWKAEGVIKLDAGALGQD